MGVGVVLSVAWFTGCGGSSPTGNGGSQTGATCGTIAGVYSESGGSCDAGFTCELDGATCVASCSDGSSVTVTPTSEGFSYSSDDGNCKASVSGQAFSGTCSKGIRICSIEGGFTKAPTNGSGGSSSGGSSSGGNSSGGSDSGGSSSGGTGTGGIVASGGAAGSGGIVGTGGVIEEPVFYCEDGDTVPLSFVCDGDDDCRSDEYNCGSNTFQCVSGTTLPGEFVCDGYIDCADEDDELDCGGDGYACDGGGTVPLDYVCDGYSDCPAPYDDETQCAQYFVCNNGAVYPAEFYCDGYGDCTNSEDEDCL